MTAVRKSGGSSVALTTLQRRSGSTWAAVQNGYRRLSGAWVQVYNAYTPVSASVNDTTANGNGVGNQPSRTVTSFPATVVTASNGNGSYTYAWTRLSGNAAISATASSAATTQFMANVPTDTTYSAVWRCTVSDGTTSAHVDVTVTLTYTDTV